MMCYFSSHNFCPYYTYKSYMNHFHKNHVTFGEVMRGNDHIFWQNTCYVEMYRIDTEKWWWVAWIWESKLFGNTRFFKIELSCIFLVKYWMNENKITYFPQKAPKIPFFNVYWLQNHQKWCATLAFTIFVNNIHLNHTYPIL